MGNAVSSAPAIALDTISSISNVVPSYTTVPRQIVSGGGTGMLTSGSLLCTYLPVPGGVKLSNLGYVNGSTAAVTPTHQWLALLNQQLQVLGVTNDQGTAGIPSFGSAQYGMTSPVIVPGSPNALQFLYICICVVAATVPTLACSTGAGNSLSTPPVQAYSSTGQTTPPAVGTTMAALTAAAAGNMAYMWAN